MAFKRVCVSHELPEIAQPIPPPAMGYYEDLPKEIADVIFQYFDERTIGVFRCACNLFEKYATEFRTRLDFNEWLKLPSLDYSKCIFESELADFFKVAITPTKVTSLKLGYTEDFDARMCVAAEAELSCLTRLDVFSCVTDRPCTNKHIAAFTSLRSLEMCCYVDASGTSNYTPLSGLTALTELSMGRTRKLKDADLVFLTNLRNLTSLGIQREPKLTGATLVHLAGLTRLTTLKLKVNSGLTDDGMPTLANLTNLRHLNLCKASRLTSNGLSHLSALCVLESLDVSCCRISPASVEVIAGLTTLKELNLKRTKSAGPAYSFLAQLTQLETLNLCRITDLSEKELVLFVPKLKSLVHLEVAYLPKMTDAEYSPFGELPNLKTLNLTGCTHFEGGNVFATLNAPQLSKLQLRECIRLTNPAVIAMERLTNLKHLDLSSTYQTRAHLHYYRGMTNLETMLLNCCNYLVDISLDQIIHLVSLKTLSLSHCEKITGAGVSMLTGLTNLTNLNLIQCSLVPRQLPPRFGALNVLQ